MNRAGIPSRIFERSIGIISDLMSEALKIASSHPASVIYPAPVSSPAQPLDLKVLVQELFEQDKLAGSLDKDIKNVKARYHQLILLKSDKT